MKLFLFHINWYSLQSYVAAACPQLSRVWLLVLSCGHHNLVNNTTEIFLGLEKSQEKNSSHLDVSYLCVYELRAQPYIRVYLYSQSC